MRRITPVTRARRYLHAGLGVLLTAIGFLWVTLLVSAWFVREHLWVLILLAAVGVGVTIHIATIRARAKMGDGMGAS